MSIVKYAFYFSFYLGGGDPTNGAEEEEEI